MVSSLPIVSIVGRPNVGKSSLFNRMVGRKAAVVDGVAGVTRDRNYAEARWANISVMVADTGGLIPTSRDSLVASIHAQVDIAISESAAIVLVVEAPTGPTDLDLLIAQQLRRRCAARVIVAANKAESREARLEAVSQIALGCGEPLAISALHGNGIGDLMDRIVSLVRPAHDTPPQSGPPVDVKLAIVGRPNAGKSLCVNRLLRQERMIIDSAPGTTRDAIDSVLKYKGTKALLIDTAGLRRKSQVKQGLEYYTNMRALSSIERADVCILMVDAAAGIATQDLKILARIGAARKGAVVALNKWDLVEKDHRTFDEMVASIRAQYMELRHVPILSVSALTGRRLTGIVDTAFAVGARMAGRIDQRSFEHNLFSWTTPHPHPLVQNKQVRILGGKQAKAAFPLFQIFCTNARLVRPSYERYLINRIHETYDFLGCPVTLSFKPPGRARRTAGSRGRPGAGKDA